MSGDNATIKALKALSRRNVFSNDEMDKHVNESAKGNDRVLAVLGGAMIEAALKGILQNEMRLLSHALSSELFMGHGPLSTFSAKITVAYALSLIDSHTRKNADYIREIRNTFSHTLHPIRFRTQEVSASCNLLIFSAGHKAALRRKGPRRKYLQAILDTGRAIWGSRPLVP